MRHYQRYYFIGTWTEIDGRLFNEVGQYAEWDEESYLGFVLSAPFIPSKDFASCGFTPAELIEYGPFANIDLAPESFKQKHLKARMILHNIREEIKARPQEPLTELASEQRT
jgi:hypothetical protein